MRKIALVTGGSRGIGAAISLQLARQGYDIWLNYRSGHEAASSAAARVEENGCECKLLPFDVSDYEAAQSVLDPLLEEQTPAVLVNNAGITRDTLFFWMAEKEWKDVVSVNLYGFFNVTRRVLPGMLRSRQGRIVNIVSTSGERGMAGQVNYSSAKAGLIGATKSLAAEVAKRNVLVNAVSPGFIDTEMTEKIPKDSILPHIPLGRLGTAQEVAEVVAFLCSDSASYITGQVIGVNGGVYM